MDLVYMNADRVELGILNHYKLDLDINREKDFEIVTLDDGVLLEAGYWWYIEGTEYGGRIDKISHDNNEKTIKYHGRNWRGLLDSKIIEPADATAYVYADGNVTEALQILLERCEFTDLFAIDDTIEEGMEPLTVSMFQYPRYCTLYAGMSAMLDSINCKMRLEYDALQQKVLIRPLLIADHSDYLTYISANSLHYIVSQRTGGINHLVCLGQGEGEARAVIHLFLDQDGAVQEYRKTDNPVRNSDYILDKTNQKIFGLDERAVTYDSPSAQITYNYVLLPSIPLDWETRYFDYYVIDERTEEDELSTARYKKVEAVIQEDYILTTSKPIDWDVNFKDYFYDEAGEWKPAAEYEGEAEYSVLTSPPNDWQTNFGAYYLRNWNGVEYTYTQIASSNEDKYKLQTQKPDDWNANYKNYFVLEQINKIEVKYTYTKNSMPKAPTWKKNTFYKKSGSDYKLTTQEPDKWSTTYKNYYTRMGESYGIANYKPVYDYKDVKPTASGKAPTWQANKYYTKYTNSIPPFWGDVTTGTQSVVRKNVPTNMPEWEEDKYYKYEKSEVAPPFIVGDYYEKAEDWYKVLAEAGVNRLAELNQSDSQTVTLKDMPAEIGDIVSGFDMITGIELYEAVTNIIVKIKNNVISTEYEIGGKV